MRISGQAVARIKDLGIDFEKVNVNGGAVGLDTHSSYWY